MDTMTKEKFLTVRWNNLLTLGLGILFLIPFFTAVDYSVGFVAFAVIIFVRLGLNLYTNHVLTRPEQYESFPFRIP
jgi:hypothetical protein